MSTSWSCLDGLIGRRVQWSTEEGTADGQIVGYRENFAKGLVLIVLTWQGAIREVPMTRDDLWVKSDHPAPRPRSGDEE